MKHCVVWQRVASSGSAPLAIEPKAAIEAVSASMFKIKDLSEGSPCADDVSCGTVRG